MADENDVQLRKLQEKLDELKKGIKGFHKKRDAERLGTLIIQEMILAISKGISPITGSSISTRMKAYRGSYKDQIKEGIKKNPGKKLRPINLTLSGKFLNDLKITGYSQEEGGVFPIVGFEEGLSAQKERGHREGVNNSEKRPIIPQDSENLSRSIRARIIDFFSQTLSNFLDKKF